MTTDHAYQPILPPRSGRHHRHPVAHHLHSNDPRPANLVFAYGFCATLDTLGVIVWLSARRMRELAIIAKLEHMKKAGLLTTTTYPDNTILEGTYGPIFTRLQETQPGQIGGI